jgi:CRISPR/Cas system-associated endoribonuclease Cas2
MLKIATLATAALVATTLSAAAHESTQPIDANRAVQERQIQNGRYSGDLTRREYRALEAEQARIFEMERRALADGHFSKREAREIKTAQKEAAQHIKDERNDNQVSWYRRWLYQNR